MPGLTGMLGTCMQVSSAMPSRAFRPETLGEVSGGGGVVEASETCGDRGGAGIKGPCPGLITKQTVHTIIGLSNEFWRQVAVRQVADP